MKRVRQTITILLLFLYSVAAAAQQYVYTPYDSIRVEKALEHSINCSEQDCISESALLFLGLPYVASTLDSCTLERIVINTREYDCTTFIETIAAIAITAKRGSRCFSDFCHTLQSLRYRNGICDGYPSRLHYISQWIADSTKQGIIEEIVGNSHTATQRLNLSFMSSHPTSYKQLKEIPYLVAEIEKFEQPFRNIDIRYIPKSALNGSPSQLNIKNGDILALVTSIKGLDVTHVGFARWIDGRLHLIHASSGKGATIIDEQTLYDYMRTKKSSLGVRVFRVLNNQK